MRLIKFLKNLIDQNIFQFKVNIISPYIEYNGYRKPNNVRVLYITLISILLLPLHLVYSDTNEVNEDINARNFIIEKDKKSSFDQSTRLYKKPPVSEEKSTNKESEIEEYEASFDPIDHQLRLLKAKEIGILPIYNHFLSLGLEAKNGIPSITYLLNSGRSVDIDYKLGLDVWLPKKLEYPQYIHSYGNINLLYQESKLGAYYKYDINSSVLENPSLNNIYQNMIINNLNTGIQAQGWLTDQIRYDMKGGYTLFSTLGKIKRGKRALIENGGSFLIRSDINMGQDLIRALDSNIELESSIDFAGFSFVDDRKIMPENEYTRGLVKLNPLLRLKTYDFNIGIGAILSGHNDKSTNSKGHIYPDIRLKYERYPLAVPFVYLKGDTYKLFWSEIFNQNSFVLVNKHNTLEHTNMPIKVGGGLTNNLPLNLSLSYGYSWMYYSNMYFFECKQSHFNLNYDTLQVHNPFAELLFKNTNEDWMINLHIDYYIYGEMETLKEPTYKPKYELELSSIYKINKIYTRGKVHWKGGIINSEKKMPEIIDIDLGGDYYFTQRLSISLDIENILFRKNYQFENMPGKGFLATLSLGYVW